MSRRILSRMGRMLSILLLTVPAFAQFDSGSSEEDGALNITENTTLTLQEDGVHEYTTINVASGVTLSFTRNSGNTPVRFLASGDVTIDGTIELSGQAGKPWNDPNAAKPGQESQPGPGGFPGGIGGEAEFNGGDGLGASGGGPGGGAASTIPATSGTGPGGNGGSHFTAGATGSGNENAAAPTYGDPRLITLTGGSGGAGSGIRITSASSGVGPSGGAGGGAILIASSGTITVNGVIRANGGNGGGGAGFSGGGAASAGGGAGGTIRLMANTITGSGSMSAVGGGVGARGGIGRIRLEALEIGGSLTGNTDPPATTTTPTIVSLQEGSVPSIRIASIGGEAAPLDPSGDPGTPDVVIPATTENPLDIVIETENVPDGSVINLRLTLENGEVLTATSSPVSSNSATATVDLPKGTGVVYATADFDPTP